MSEGALFGVRVLEFSEMIAAPFAGMHLGDLGAEVIKVEPPEGDPWRHSLELAPNESRTFLSLNRNKRGITLDLKRPEAQEVVHRLVPQMDVVIVNYRPDVPKRLGIDYETLSARNPRLIYVQNTAMGGRGAQSHRPGYDLIAQAATGLMRTGGRLDPDGVPLPVTPAIGDYATGLVIALATCAALVARERTGLGQKVDTTLLGTSLALQTSTFLRTSLAPQGPEATATGSNAGARALNAYYRVYRTKDSLIAVACLTPALQRKMADAIAVHDVRHERTIPRDSEEAKAAAREFSAAAVERFAQRTTDEWLEVFDTAGVPAAPVRSVTELFDDPQVAANDLVAHFEHPVAGAVSMVGPVIQMARTPSGVRRPPPTLGQHNDEVLREFGYTSQEIERLRTAGALAH
jgi:crotonobetainyl-CoA:carnitine CoA-transferase CaiB-like acyl-CoA transferase